MSAPQENAVVIGAGIGGTALTLMLAQAGIPVTLLEKNAYIGGSCAGYEKHGFQIDFGTHMFTRGPRGPLGEVLRRAGHPDAVEFRRTSNIADLRALGPDGPRSVAMPSQLHRFPLMGLRLIKEANLSPFDVLAATRLLTALMTMSDEDAAALDHITVQEYVERYTTNPRIGALLQFLLGLYFVIPPWETSAGESVYAFQRMFRDNWLSYPKGGAKAIPTTYVRLAEELGATVRTRSGVKRILIEDGRTVGVELEDGERIDATIVISTSSVKTTATRLCDPADLPADYVEMARNIQGSLIAVQLKIALDKKLVDAGCIMGAASLDENLFNASPKTMQNLFEQVGRGDVPDVTTYYCPVPTNFDPDLAPEGHQLLTVCAMAPTTEVELSGTSLDWEDALMETMKGLVPGLEDHILFVDRTTTHWMEHWIGKEGGPAISTAQTPDQVGDRRPGVTTPIAGLYLAGCGAGGRGVGTELAADSAMECAEQIVKDLGQIQPASWNTDRRRSPSLTRTMRLLLRPTKAFVGR
ncbi:MAG: phytoene desaturase family protein [Aeromicrobium sp.]